jgi:hypothetical protein
MRLILPAMAALALALLCAPAQAQATGEQAGQQACGSDVFSLCGDAIPDRGRIEACLRRNFSRVSSTCRTFMASYGRAHSTNGTSSAHRTTARRTRHHVRRHTVRHRHRYVRREHRHHHYYR